MPLIYLVFVIAYHSVPHCMVVVIQRKILVLAISHLEDNTAMTDHRADGVHPEISKSIAFIRG